MAISKIGLSIVIGAIVIGALIIWSARKDSMLPARPKEKKRQPKGDLKFQKQLDDSGVIKTR